MSQRRQLLWSLWDVEKISEKTYGSSGWDRVAYGGLEGRVRGSEEGNQQWALKHPGAGNCGELFPLLGPKGDGSREWCDRAACHAAEDHSHCHTASLPASGVLPVRAIRQPQSEQGRREAGRRRPQRSDLQRTGQGGDGPDWRRQAQRLPVILETAWEAIFSTC